MVKTKDKYLGGSDLQKTKKVRIVGIVGKTLVQNILSLDKLSLR